MSDVKRYAIDSSGGFLEYEHEDGDYVKHSDHIKTIEQLQAENERLKQRWISVDDRLPDYGSKFLGQFDNMEILSLWYWADTFENCTAHKLCGKLTHWQPMPEPVK